MHIIRLKDIEKNCEININVLKNKIEKLINEIDI